MKVFLEYLEESFNNSTELRKDLVSTLIIPTYDKLIGNHGWHEEDILTDLVPQCVHDYFATEFERCDNCNEWTRRDDLHQARYDVNEQVCPQCREDGC